MKRKLMNLFIAIGLSFIIVLFLFLVTWLVTVFCSFVGKWGILVYIAMFLALIWLLYKGLGSDDEGDSDNDDKVGEDE
jgi:hypothetical protein